MHLYVALYFCALIFLSAISAIPGVAALILIFTFGLGLPVMFSSTILVYSLSALPLYVWATAEERRWILLPFAVLAMPLVAVGLPLISWKLQDVYFAQVPQDIIPGQLQRPEVIEIVDSRVHSRSVRSADQPIPCDDRCLRLLFSGDVREIRLTRFFQEPVRSGPNSDWLRTAQREGGGAIRPESLTYKLERLEECPAGAFAGRIPPRWVKEKMADGRCLVAIRGASSSPEFRITVSERLGGGALGGSFLFRPLNVRQLLVESLSDEDATLVLRRTQVFSQRLSMPLMIWYKFVHGGFPTELELLQVRSTQGAFDVDRALRDAFGFSPSSQQPS